MKESKVFEVPMDQIKMEVIDAYDGDIVWLVENIAVNVQNLSDQLIGTTWWNSFDSPANRHKEITDMAWETENLWINKNFDDGFYEVDELLFGSRGIDPTDKPSAK